MNLKILTAKNLEKASFAPLRTLEAWDVSERINESNVQILEFFSLNLYISIGVVAIFLGFSAFYENPDDKKVEEISPLLITHQTNKEFMKKLLRQFKAKLSTQQIGLIIQYLDRSKEKIKSSKIRQAMARQLRLIYQNRYKLMHIYYQSACIELCHIAVKSARALKSVRSS